MTIASAVRLSPQECLQFHELGWAGPFELYTRQEMLGLQGALDRVHHDEWGREFAHNRHLSHRVVWDMASNPAIVDRTSCLLGNDLQLWRSHFWVKMPGGKEIPWHQDANYWPIEPAIVISAWIAIDDVDRENSCMQIIPGSHRRIRPHIPAREEMAFREMAEPGSYDEREAIDLELRAGQFILFNERTLHHSHVNGSQRRRAAIAMRMITPQVRVLEYDGDEHGVCQLAGEDRLGFNRIVAPATI